MINWLDTPLVTLFDTITITRSWLIIALASVYAAWVAHSKRRSMLLWFAGAVSGYIAASELSRDLIPDAVQELQRGEMPSAAHTIWSGAAFRADFGLLLVLMVLVAVLNAAVHRLYGYATSLRAATSWPVRLSMISSALVLAFPLILWVWTAGWFVVESDFTDFLIPLAAFMGVALLTGALYFALEDWQQKLAIWAVALGVVLAQLRYNALRPPGSMFESNGSVPFFMALIPVLLALFVAQSIRRGRRRGQYAAMVLELGGLTWLMALVGWAIKFMGFYNYQDSYAFSLGSLFETPIRVVAVLDKFYYDLVPRQIAESRNVANMNDWEAAVVVLSGTAAWLVVISLLQWHVPVKQSPTTLGQNLARIRHPQLSLRQRRYILAFALITPAVALRTFTTFYPFIQTLILSFQKYNPAFPPRQYVDFRNFERISTDLVVRESLEFTLVFVFVSTFFQMFLGLVIAHLLNANFRLRGLARTISLIPWAVPMVVAAIGFRWMFDDQFGMIPDLLGRVGIHEKWLVDPVNAQVAVIFVNVWKSTPFCALLLLAGMQGISLDLYEAAKVDGANWFDSLRFITVPMIMPIMVTVTMFMLVWQLAVFDLPFAMTGGAPGFATTVVAQKIYLEINSLNYSFAAAISVMLVLIVTLIGGAGVYTLRRVEVSA
ncbi:MAG: ABC transporter permease subunit [Anaerolineae bacterium]|nr:ABC transporter permease subunit [Anaerolineae bacterium]